MLGAGGHLVPGDDESLPVADLPQVLSWWPVLCASFRCSETVLVCIALSWAMCVPLEKGCTSGNPWDPRAFPATPGSEALSGVEADPVSSGQCPSLLGQMPRGGFEQHSGTVCRQLSWAAPLP